MAKGNHSVGKTHQKLFGAALRPVLIIAPVSSGSGNGAGVGVNLLMAQ